MATYQKAIATRLKSLNDIEGVTVDPIDTINQISIKHERHHVADFLFVWSEDHYIGYFVSAKGRKSQAIISLWKPLEVVKFMMAYMSLVELGAMRPSPLAAK